MYFLKMTSELELNQQNMKIKTFESELIKLEKILEQR